MWRLTKGGQLMTCELHTGDLAGASCEVVIQRDGEWLFGRLCPERSFARYVAHALKHDHLKSGWVESYGARIAGGCAEAGMDETNRQHFDDQDTKQLAPNEQLPESDERDAQPADDNDDDEEFEDESDDDEGDEDETDESEETAS